MAYIIKKTERNKVYLTENDTKVNVDITIWYNLEGDTKLQDSSIGTTIILFLDTDSRNTIVAELSEKTIEWFNTNYNSAP